MPESLPSDMFEFWSEFDSVELFVDRRFGGGLILFDVQTSDVATKLMFEKASDDLFVGDRVLGQFVGDSEQLVIRCDRDSDDFGNVLIRSPTWLRNEWFIAASTLREVLRKYGECEARKYWEPQEQQRM